MRKRETNDSYKSQQKVSFFNFLAELPNFIAVTVSAIISGSLIVWMDLWILGRTVPVVLSGYGAY